MTIDQRFAVKPQIPFIWDRPNNIFFAAENPRPRMIALEQ